MYIRVDKKLSERKVTKVFVTDNFFIHFIKKIFKIDC